MLSKGSGLLAALIRQTARRHRIPIVRSPALARMIHQEVALGQEVAPHITPLAQLLLWVERRRRSSTFDPRNPIQAQE